MSKVHAEANLVWHMTCDACDWSIEVRADIHHDIGGQPLREGRASEALVRAALEAHIEAVHGGTLAKG